MGEHSKVHGNATVRRYKVGLCELKEETSVNEKLRKSEMHLI